MAARHDGKGSPPAALEALRHRERTEKDHHEVARRNTEGARMADGASVIRAGRQDTLAGQAGHDYSPVEALRWDDALPAFRHRTVRLS